MLTAEQKKEIRARARLHHAEGGRVLTALDKILNTAYPDGTNLVQKFLEEMKGLPYGAVNMCMDKRTDCNELYRITYFIWFNIDIGSFSDAAYKSKLGHFVTDEFSDLKNLPFGVLCFFHTNSRKITGHVAGLWGDGKCLFQSGASILGAKVGFTSINWGKTKHFMCAKEFLTPAMREMVTYRAVTPVKPPTPHVERLKYMGATYMNIRRSASVKDSIIGKVEHNEIVIKLAETGDWVKVDDDGVIGYCWNEHFVAV